MDSPSRNKYTPNRKLANMVARWVPGRSLPSSETTPSEDSISASLQISTSTRKYSVGNMTALFANIGNGQTFHPALRPPQQIPRSSISSSSDISSSTGSRSIRTALSMASSYDVHHLFRKNIHSYLGTHMPPLSSMYEDGELVWSPGHIKLDQISLAPSTHSDVHVQAPDKTPVRDPAKLPIFATCPVEKIVIDPADMKDTTSPAYPATELVRIAIHPGQAKNESHSTTVYAIDVSPSSVSSNIIASKHGDGTIRIHQDGGTSATALKINFYIQQRERSRDFFVTSHAILSTSRTLIAIAAGFGHTVEIWDWTRRKRLQVLSEAAYRWAAPRVDVYDDESVSSSGRLPLACYREAADSIALLYPNVPPTPDKKSQVPFNVDSPTVIDLTKANLPHIPKLPELALSSTAPILVAAAGPRSPRSGHPPPQHAALLMAWTLHSPGSGTAQPHRPWRFAMPTQHNAQLATALPCGLATHGGVAVSIWIPHNVRVIGAPGRWQVEPVEVRERWVVVWEFEAATGAGSSSSNSSSSGDGTTTRVFAIPNDNTIACISPDCRFVAYRQGPGTEPEGGCLVVLDALGGGREVWRTPRCGGGGCAVERDCGQLMDLSRVSAIAFSADGNRLLLGDTSGSVGSYEVRTTGTARQEGFGIALKQGESHDRRRFARV
ncbi:unnamed protein product [Discula destructiva]